MTTQPAMLAVNDVIQSILTLLTEAYEGPPNPRETWFIDNVPDSGVLGVLNRVSALEASTSVDGSGKPGSTIAANAEHLRWSLANANGALRGQEYQPDWQTSWNVLDADGAAWDQLRAELRREYEDLREAIRQQQALEGDFLNGLLALIPHAAFHLGVIRQMIERVRAEERGEGPF